MATGRQGKRAKKLNNMHEYFHKKVEEVEKERNYDRTCGTKQQILK